MLSIGKLGADQVGYYERSVAKGRDDYYSGRGEAPGTWMGRGAEALGLRGQVQSAQFNALMKGVNPCDPDGGRLRDSGRDPRVVAFDLTFSAPKSVSVEYATQDDATRAALVDAHEAAVAAALGYIEDEAVRVRRGHAGAQVLPGGGVVAGAYRHRMSRALDPQLHTHVVCANIAQGPDGRWTALHAKPLYRHAQTAGYLYQAHLRAEVRNRLGWEWGPVAKGMAELAHSPRELLEHFSQRSAAVREAAAESGQQLDSWARRNLWALRTRERKHYGIDDHTWFEEVSARAAEHGHDRAAREAVVAEGRRRLQAGLSHEDPAGARELGDRLAGAAGLTDRANAFDERDALREFAAAAQQGARVEDVRGRGAGFAARGDVLATAAGRMTTADLVSSERRLIASAVGRAGEGTAVVAQRVLERALAGSDRPLSGEQAAAVRAVARSGNGVDVIEALAGTGKTFTAGTIGQVYEDAGYHVIGMAPTGRAVRELTEEAGIASWTIDRALLGAEQFDDRLPPRTVIVLDEAGMASTRLTERLLAYAGACDAKVIAIGDCGQLASVQAGGWLRAVADRVGAQALTQVMRQRDPAERIALGRLHAGEADGYLRWAEQSGRIAVHTEAGARAAALADWQQAVAEHGPVQAVLIARRQDTRTALNEAAREQRRHSGALGPDVTYGPVTVATGDRVICRHNDEVVDVDNGTRGTVRATHPDRVVLETDAGTVRELPAGYVAEHLEHAYCLTGHGMQGGTVEHATVLAEVRDLTKGWSYTALSRARGSTRLHIDAADVQAALERDELGGADRPQRPDRSQVMARAREQMKVRDDEDLALSQLPTRPAAGRPDDPALRAAPPEQLAEHHDPHEPVVSAARLGALQDDRRRLRTQLEGLPLTQLRQLDAIAAERARVDGQRRDITERLRALPGPTRSRFGRVQDQHGAERARLTAAVGAADEQIAALDTQAERAQRTLGPADAIREERAGLQRRIAELEHDVRLVRDELAERILASRPGWGRELFGERPGQYKRAEYWDRAVRDVARYRIEHGLGKETLGLGPEPAGGEARGHWRQIDRVVEQTQRRLGHDIDRGHDLHRER